MNAPARQNKRGAVLFDLDYTLWDHATAQATAIRHICERHTLNFDEFYPLYTCFNREGWEAFARRTISLSQMRIGRFEKTIAALELTHLSPSVLSNEYLRIYPEGIYLVDGAEELLRLLKPHFIIGIITNGTRDTQGGKVERSPLNGYPDFIVTVDDAKCSKPSPEFFKFAFRRAGVPLGQITCVGDSYEDDIIGAARAGAGRTVWFNPEGAPIPEDHAIRPDHIIKHLKELPPILLGK